VTAPAGVLPTEVEQLWNEGSFEDRKAVLERMRSVEPSRGRDRLREAWAKEKADSRTAFLSILITGLGPEDEEFLEVALDDRSQNVRRQAATLLSRLPDSAFAARMRARAEAILRFEVPKEPEGFWSKVKSAVGARATGNLDADPPREIDKSWERDGIPPKAPAGVGLRAFWLSETMALVPPPHWDRRFQASPAELLAAANRTDWATALAEGWSRAALGFAAEEWMAPLWDFWFNLEESKETGVSPERRRELLFGLLRRMPSEAAEERLLAILEGKSAVAQGRMLPVGDLLKGLPSPWSQAISRAWLSGAQQVCARLAGLGEPGFDPWLETMERAAHAIPEELFPAALASWPELDTADGYRRAWSLQLGSFTQIVQIRKSLKEEIIP
jgi:hypothetical protein